MVYVFIFIALRALRFEPRFILLAGAAALGWLGLVLYVVFSVSGDPMDYPRLRYLFNIQRHPYRRRS